MSRTYRKVEWAKWYRKPKTKNLINIKTKYIEEVKEELSSNYIRPRDDCLNLPVAWDDRHCVSYIKEWSEEKRIDTHLEPYINAWLEKYEFESRWFTEIDFNKNIVRVANKMHGIVFNKPSYYLPFIIETKKARYKVKINPISWRHI